MDVSLIIFLGLFLGLPGYFIWEATQRDNKGKPAKSNASFQCRICQCPNTVKFADNPDKKYDYPYKDEASIIKKMPCRFCKTQLTVVVFKSGSVHGYDDELEAELSELSPLLRAAKQTLNDAELELESAELELEDRKEELSQDKNNAEIKQEIADIKASIPALRKAYKAAEKQENKLYNQVMKIEDKHMDKRGNPRYEN